MKLAHTRAPSQMSRVSVVCSFIESGGRSSSWKESDTSFSCDKLTELIIYMHNVIKYSNAVLSRYPSSIFNSVKDCFNSEASSFGTALLSKFELTVWMEKIKQQQQQYVLVPTDINDKDSRRGQIFTRTFACACDMWPRGSSSSYQDAKLECCMVFSINIPNIIDFIVFLDEFTKLSILRTLSISTPWNPDNRTQDHSESVYTRRFHYANNYK